MSQVTPVLPVVGVYSGLAAAGYINSGFATLNTCWLGSSAPSDAPNGIPAAGQFWVDTSSAGYQLIKRYDGASWVIDSVIDTTNHILCNPIGGGTVSIASASTTDLGSKNEAYQTITGTTTITSFGSNVPRGQVKIITFGGVLTLTYNATSLILNGASNITTAAGDSAIMVSLGSGNWKCIFYGKISGAQLSMTGAEATVASATTTDLASGGSNAIAISGTTTITSFGSNATLANPYYLIRFTGALILTHNATSLILQGGANIVTAAGDTGIAQYLGSGNWRVSNYTRADGQSVSALGALTTLASATTTDLGSLQTNLVSITGTTTITAFGSSASLANPYYITKFTGALILTHNATSLIMPGSANYTTVAGDVFFWLYEGSGNWRCVGYNLKSGLSIVPANTYTHVTNGPTGTTNTSGLMMGLAGAITPNGTGTVLVTLNGYVTNTSTGGVFVVIKWNTGTAPVNGAAVTGVTAGGVVQYGAPSIANTQIPVGMAAIITGLVPGTPIWVDIALGPNTAAGTAAISSASLSIAELK